VDFLADSDLSKHPKQSASRPQAIDRTVCDLEGEMDKEKTCSNCGSIYRLSYTRCIMRDRDSIDCEVCGVELHRWNEAKLWQAQLLERHDNHITS
jgi:hypothetical protein